jgi:hypothetical protein
MEDQMVYIVKNHIHLRCKHFLHYFSFDNTSNVTIKIA